MLVNWDTRLLCMHPRKSPSLRHGKVDQIILEKGVPEGKVKFRLKSIMLRNLPIILSGISFFSSPLFPKLCLQFLLFSKLCS